MVVVGVDGCPKGWIMVKYQNGKYFYGVYETFRELILKHPGLDRIFIDMPIGLSSKSRKRTIDQSLRKELKGRASTVFNAPCRAAVYAANSERSKQINIAIEGKSLSIQSLSMIDKIRQIDEYLLEV